MRQIERDHLHAGVRKVIREKAAPGGKAVAGIRHVDIDLLDLHFEHVAGFGLGDLHGPGQDVTSGTFLFHLFMDIAVVLRNGLMRHTGGFHALQRAGRNGVHADRVAGVNGKRGLDLGGIVAPGDSSGRSRQIEISRQQC